MIDWDLAILIALFGVSAFAGGFFVGQEAGTRAAYRRFMEALSNGRE
jgi:hypothetical protein